MTFKREVACFVEDCNKHHRDISYPDGGFCMLSRDRFNGETIRWDDPYKPCGHFQMRNRNKMKTEW